MKKFNLFDGLIILIIIGLVVLGTFTLFKKPVISGKTVLLTVKVEQNADVIFTEAIKTTTVFFDSVNAPVEEVRAVKNGNAVDITLKANGQIEPNKVVFDGVRVLVGQKAEIHGNYFAQGVISEIKYAE